MKYASDLEHLRLLSIFHYVFGGLIGLFSLFPMIHIVMGIIFLNLPAEDGGENPLATPVLGWFLIGFPILLILMGLSIAFCIAMAGRKLSNQTGYVYCLVMAALECCFVPFGTVLGVFTIVVLQRPSVREMFGRPVNPA